MLSKEQRDIIRARDKARTKGRWQSCAPTKRNGFVFGGNEIVADDGPIIVQWNGFDSADGTKARKRANSVFLAACSVDIPNLLDTCDELEEALDATIALLRTKWVAAAEGMAYAHGLTMDAGESELAYHALELREAIGE